MTETVDNTADVLIKSLNESITTTMNLLILKYTVTDTSADCIIGIDTIVRGTISYN